MAAPKVYLSPAMHMANPCVYPRPDGKQCYEALENNEYIDILEPILNRCGIRRSAAIGAHPRTATTATPS